MGQPNARLQDICTGHYCFPPRPNNQASQNVFVNSLGQHRVTDSWQVHCCKGCHSSNTCAGSSTVFCNSLAVARIGDPVCCGSRIMTGSHNVFTGG